MMARVDEIEFTGAGLNRPECVLTHESGLLITADWTDSGGIALLDHAGTVSRILAKDAPRQMRPNGVALEPGGSVLLADLGVEEGGVWRLDPDGHVEPIVVEIAGHVLPPTNFVLRDADERLWITVSTRRRPRSDAYRRDVADGFIVLFKGGKARIVADGLGFTNECILSPDGAYLYVNETFARRLSRFPLRANGKLGEKEVFVEFGEGTFPDGVAFDADGGLWITSIVSNRVIRVSPDRQQELILEDADPDHVRWVESAYSEHALGRPHLDRLTSTRLKNISSLAFGGADLMTAYLGCLLGDSIASFRTSVPGYPPPHWSMDLGPLSTASHPSTRNLAQ
jgi:sugar lactone lactonase YvrE